MRSPCRGGRCGAEGHVSLPDVRRGLAHRRQWHPVRKRAGRRRRRGEGAGDRRTPTRRAVSRSCTAPAAGGVSALASTAGAMDVAPRVARGTGSTTRARGPRSSIFSANEGQANITTTCEARCKVSKTLNAPRPRPRARRGAHDARGRRGQRVPAALGRARPGGAGCWPEAFAFHAAAPSAMSHYTDRRALFPM